ncbi:MAG TPA: TIGR00730 family Rossman fold protein [Ilumatobacteraceae bacterium]|nr:TIGR00730 family Rossman fold protein [Ilumatobacteraceae bacterium]HUC33410.1 TIGR00730 family Rossman fold protein [Ilumatobacteraceae bacterium]
MSDRPTCRLCLYCGSNSGTNVNYADTARRLGASLARRDIGLVYGGGSVGLMGVAADAAMEAGGEVIGVITEQLVNAEVAHQGLTRLEVVDSMHDRKARLADLADGFIVLPGGFGTVDEFAEMLTWNQLGIVAKPVVLLDIDGFWGPLLTWMDRAVDEGFVRAAHRVLAQRAGSVDEAIALATSPVPRTPHKWLDRDGVSPPRP